MKNLINSMELISFTYTNSNNNTLNKFGIEYSYIAMNNMLKSTNNNIKNIEINKTLGIAIDWNWGCILSTLIFVGSWIAVIGGDYYVPATLVVLRVYGFLHLA